jgi:uncharacterized protein
MAKNYVEIAFTQSVKKQQEQYGSVKQYERMAAIARGTELSFAEVDFIQEQDSFYLATVGENGYPYVQFRGGPKGFLKVLDLQTLAYADFRGNLQYISTGNLNHNDKASLILMDYVKRQRLKIYARVEIKEAADVPNLIAQLEDKNYKARVERAMILHLDAFDWNCPQHITQRFTLDEIENKLKPYTEKISQLEAELEKLKNEKS